MGGSRVKMVGSAQTHISYGDRDRGDGRFGGCGFDVRRRVASPGVSGAPWFRPGFPYNQNFPDPQVVKDGSTYYAYGSSTGGSFLPVMTSTDLTTWTARPAYSFPGGCAPGFSDPFFNDALPCRPSWAKDFGRPTGSTAEVIAPGVIKNGSTWLVYSSVLVDAPVERHCISVATSNSPLGPFTVQGSGPIQCDADPGGSRDAEPFRDVDNNLYLIWKSEGVPGSQPTRIWSRRLSGDGLSFANGSAPTAILQTSEAWEGGVSGVIENPSMVAWNGGWWLFYSGNRWQGSQLRHRLREVRERGGPVHQTARRPAAEEHRA